MAVSPPETQTADLVTQLADAARDAVLTQRRSILAEPASLRTLTVEIALSAAGQTVVVREAEAYLSHHILMRRVLGLPKN